MVPGKEDYGATISYFESELRRLGVHLHLGHEVGEDDADLIADCVGVVLATGVHPRAVDIPGARPSPTSSTTPRRSSRASATRGPWRSSAPAASASTSPTSSPTSRPTPPTFFARYGVAPPAVVRYSPIGGVSLHSETLERWAAR